MQGVSPSVPRDGLQKDQWKKGPGDTIREARPFQKLWRQLWISEGWSFVCMPANKKCHVINKSHVDGLKIQDWLARNPVAPWIGDAVRVEGVESSQSWGSLFNFNTTRCLCTSARHCRLRILSCSTMPLIPAVKRRTNTLVSWILTRPSPKEIQRQVLPNPTLTAQLPKPRYL